MTLPPLRLILLAPLLPLALIVMLVASLLWLLVEPDADEICAEHLAGLDAEARQIVAALNEAVENEAVVCYNTYVQDHDNRG